MARGDAQQKARQRARNAGSGTRSGSSGITKDVASMEAEIDWDDLEGKVEHIADLMGRFQSGQIMANRTLTGTLVVPPEHAHKMLELALRSQSRAVIIRAYTVPMSAVVGRDDDDDE